MWWLFLKPWSIQYITIAGLFMKMIFRKIICLVSPCSKPLQTFLLFSWKLVARFFCAFVTYCVIKTKGGLSC